MAIFVKRPYIRFLSCVAGNGSKYILYQISMKKVMFEQSGRFALAAEWYE